MKTRGMRSGGVGASLVAVALVAGSLPALALDLTFERTWGGPEQLFAPVEQAEGVAVAPDGSAYIIGQTSSFGTGADNNRSDIFLVKYAPDGSIAWQRTYGVGATGLNNFGMDVEVAPDGTVWITGELQGNVLLAQFDADGNLLSERTFAGADSPRAMDIADDGSIYVTGFEFPGAGQGDAFVLKTAPDGTLAWLTTWGLVEGFDIGFDVAAASDGTVYLAGDSGNEAFVVKFDQNGNLIWDRTWHAGTSQDFSSGQGVAIGPDGEVYLTGSALISGVSDNAVLVKFTPDGSVIWDRTWLAKDASNAFGVAVTSGGNIVITGANVSFKYDDAEAFVAEFLPDGTVQQAATWGAVNKKADPDDFGAVSDQIAQAVAVADDGSLFVAGGTTGPPPYTFGKATKKTGTPDSTVGTPMGTVTSPAIIVADPNGIVQTPNGSETFAGGTDAFLLRMTQ
jgi:uncharacterized delta-60 repeat protein